MTVGLFPGARQADLAIEDLTGNVLEWCDTFDNPTDKEKPGAPRVLRGGAWGFNRGYARSAFRSGNFPSDRIDVIGFRVVCLSPAFGH